GPRRAAVHRGLVPVVDRDERVAAEVAIAPATERDHVVCLAEIDMRRQPALDVAWPDAIGAGEHHDALAVDDLLAVLALELALDAVLRRRALRLPGERRCGRPACDEEREAPHP